MHIVPKAFSLIEKKSMAKNKSANGHRSEAVHDHSKASWIRRDSTGRFVDQKSASEIIKGGRREILFPTEPSTIGHEKIDRAVERVQSRKK